MRHHQWYSAPRHVSRHLPRWLRAAHHTLHVWSTRIPLVDKAVTVALLVLVMGALGVSIRGERIVEWLLVAFFQSILRIDVEV